jgi:hypothetical protein
MRFELRCSAAALPNFLNTVTSQNGQGNRCAQQHGQDRSNGKQAAAHRDILPILVPPHTTSTATKLPHTPIRHLEIRVRSGVTPAMAAGLTDHARDKIRCMGKSNIRYVAKAEPPRGWRVWDREMPK